MEEVRAGDHLFFLNEACEDLSCRQKGTNLDIGKMSGLCFHCKIEILLFHISRYLTFKSLGKKEERITSSTFELELANFA